MNRKVIEMGVEPIKPTTGDKWVDQARESQGAATQIATHGLRDRRLTVNVPTELHRRLKLHCVSTNTLMTDFVQSLLERAVAELPPVKV